MSATLDLAAVFDRDDVRMPDGSTYELRNPQEFGILDDHRLRTLIEKIQKLSGQPTKTEEEAEQASGMLRELAAMIVVDCPDDMPDWACVAVFDFWISRKVAADNGDPEDPQKPRTTGRSSRGYSRSTAGARKTGSTSRRTS